MLYDSPDKQCYIYPPGSRLVLDWLEIKRLMHCPNFEADLSSNSVAWLKERGAFPPEMPQLKTIDLTHGAGLILTDETGVAQPTAVALMLMKLLDIDVPAGLRGIKIGGRTFRLAILQNQPSPEWRNRKFRTIGDIVKSEEVEQSVGVLQFSRQAPSWSGLADYAAVLGIKISPFEGGGRALKGRHDSLREKRIAFTMSLDTIFPEVRYYLGILLYFAYSLEVDGVGVKEATLVANWKSAC